MTLRGDSERLVITEGDTEDWVWDLTHYLTEAARNLTGATAKLWMWTLPGQSVHIEGATCTHDDTGGQVTYDVQDEDVDDPGLYQLQLIITLDGGEIKRYPDPNVQGRLLLEIIEAVESTDTDAD